MEIDHLWLALLGAAVIAVALFDLVVTTLSVAAGQGPLARVVAGGVSGLARAGTLGHRQLRRLGIVGAISMPVVWVALTWTGFALMFLADDDAVLVAASQEPAAALGRIAYAAGGLAGAGASLVAGTETWELVNNIAAIVGLAIMTLGLTYLFQVVTSVKSERSTSSMIDALGRSPAEAVAVALRAPGMGTFPQQLTDIAAGISSTAQGHLALPMLRFFHSAEPDTAVPVNLARYDDILLILDHALPDGHAPTVRAGRHAVEAFLATLRLPEPDGAIPPVPDLAPLRAVRDDVVDDATFAERCRDDASRRARLLAYVASERWSWDDVATPRRP